MKKITFLALLMLTSLGFAQGLETFDNVDLSGSTYSDGSFTGQDGSTWNFISCRGDIDIIDDDQALTLRNVNSGITAEVTSGTISGGIGTLNFDYMQAFSNDVELQVLVNDVLYTTVTSDDEQDVALNSGDIVIDQPGDVVIKFFNPDGAQVAIDNVEWTSFDGTPQPFLSISAPSDNQVFAPSTTEIDVDLTVNNFALSTDETSADGDGYIQYSLNGGSFENAFSENFTIDGLTEDEYDLVVKLVDNNGDDLDPVVEQTRSFTIPGITQVENITELRADYEVNGEGRFYEITGASIFTHQDDFNNRKWFQDENNAGIMIFDGDAIIANDAYVEGDNVEGLIGETAVYNGVLQLIPTEDSGVVVGNTTPEIQVITMSEYNTNYQDYESTLIGFTDVTFEDGDGSAEFSTGSNYTVMDDSDEVVMRTDFFNANYIGTIIPSTTVQGLVGLASSFNGTAQIFVRDNDDIDVFLNTNEFNNAEFSVYPNPASDVVNFTAPRSEKFEVNIYNVLGRNVQQTTVEGNTQINVGQLQSGVYMVKFTQGNQSFTKKLIIK
ncbi:MAG: T9SS type A sorting domain-containing protein [Bacteroidota bacterium]